VSTGLIRRLNGLKDDTIRIGKELAIPDGPFAAVIDRSAFTITISLHGEPVKQYAIATGRDGSTPAGEFEVRSRVENPEWTSPEGDFFKAGDPANPLGARWLGFGEGGYGIHGTTDPSSIGRMASRGCVRLNNDDVLEVYDFLTLGSKVTIR
jgi:lipoprotein-anchoring transpeptidase ErfK/SrfK